MIFTKKVFLYLKRLGTKANTVPVYFDTKILCATYVDMRAIPTLGNGNSELFSESSSVWSSSHFRIHIAAFTDLVILSLFAVQKPREQIADAEAVMNLTNSFLGSVKASNRKTGTSPAAYVGAILATFGKRTASTDDEAPVEIDWGKLGLAAIGFFREAPGVATM